MFPLTLLFLLLTGSAETSVPEPRQESGTQSDGKQEDGKQEAGKEKKKKKGAAETPADQKSGKKKKEKEKAKAKEYPQFKLDDHPSIHFAKGTHLDFKGRFAPEVKDSDAPPPDPSEAASVDLGRKRLGVEGEIHNDVEFQVEAELQNHDPWRDVYADFKRYDAVRVRGGHFKLPFGRDELTGPTHLDFMFRSLAATHLAPGRDTGVMVHGRVVDKTISYEAGVFNHDGKNARTSNPDKVYGGQTIAARVTYEPLRAVKNANTDLSVGAAFTTSEVPEGIAGLRGLMVYGQKFFSASNYPVNGKRRRTGVEFMVRPGPASVQAEWMRASTQRKGESVDDTDLSPLVGEGWYVSGTFALTGEKKSRVDRPTRPFLRGGAGAIEVAARVESLGFKSDHASEPPSTSPRAEVVVPNRDRVVTVGANWYVNRFVKIQANFIRERLDDGTQGPLPPQTTFTTRAVRFQLYF
jgi:phosphate-selective porin OprO/OprP